MLELLKSKFVVAWRNIEKETYVGASRGYGRGQSAVGTTNGAGARNTQIFILSKDQRVLHALPGFWHPKDFARALRFGLAMNRLWQDEQRSERDKKAMFFRMHLVESRYQPAIITARSGWQGFDARTEQNKLRSGDRDTFFESDPEGGGRRIKPINLIVHERMAIRQFVPFVKFDVGTFADLGQRFYDLNRGRDGNGRRFARAEKNARVQRKKELRVAAAGLKVKRKAELNEWRRLAGFSER